MTRPIAQIIDEVKRIWGLVESTDEPSGFRATNRKVEWPTSGNLGNSADTEDLSKALTNLKASGRMIEDENQYKELSNVCAAAFDGRLDPRHHRDGRFYLVKSSGTYTGPDIATFREVWSARLSEEEARWSRLASAGSGSAAPETAAAASSVSPRPVGGPAAPPQEGILPSISQVPALRWGMAAKPGVDYPSAAVPPDQDSATPTAEPVGGFVAPATTCGTVRRRAGRWRPARSAAAAGAASPVAAVPCRRAGVATATASTGGAGAGRRRAARAGTAGR